MTRAEDLLKALNGLKSAAGNELSGEAHEVALQHIKGLFRLAGFDGEDTGEGGNEAPVSFAQALANVRTQAAGEMSGNAFYLASNSLDDLAGLSSGLVTHSPEHAPEPVLGHASGTAAEPAPAAPNFDDLAAASKARVEEAASVGAKTAHYQTTRREHHEADEHDDVLAGMEFEKRSSEPCCMPEILPLTEEPVTEPPAVKGIQALSAREVAQATHHFGTPAAEAGHVPDHGARREEAASYAETARAFERKAAASARVEPSMIVTKAERRPASPTPETPKVAAKTFETAPKQQHKTPEKTFFSLWVDMVFGRRK
jgi:hypothetical protein